jgi:hypothetical protein
MFAAASQSVRDKTGVLTLSMGAMFLVTKRKLGMLLVSGMGIMVGCSDSDASTSDAAGGSAGSAGGSSSLTCDSADPTQLEGTWALLARYNLKLDSQTGGVVTMCPENQSAPAFLMLIMDIQRAQSQDQWSVSAIPCDLELPSVSAMVGECRPEQGNLLGVEIPIPTKLIQSLSLIPPVDVNGLSTQKKLSFDTMEFTWGSREGNMPAWDTERSGCGMTSLEPGRSNQCEVACVDGCENLHDDEKDDYPGVTVHLCGTTQDDVAAKVTCQAEEPATPGVTLQGLIRMAFRTDLTLSGDAKSACEASGSFHSNTVYSVVGADAYLANSRISVASVIRSLPLFEGIEEESRWRMIRVDGRHGAADWQLPADSVGRCAVARSHRNDFD